MKFFIEKTCLLAFFTAACISLTGCDKENQVTGDPVNGIVYDGTSLEPLENATVYLCTASDLFTILDTIENTTTDAAGNYLFSTALNTLNEYAVIAEKENYFPEQAVVLTTDDGPNAQLYLDPQATLILHIKNIEPVDSTDYISVRISNGADNNELYYFTIYEYSLPIDTTLTLTVYGNQYNYIYCRGSWNGDSQAAPHYLYCPAIDTTDFEIEF